MNYIVAALFYHCGEVLAFEFTLRALNDYHLKEVYMYKLSGLDYHIEILQAIFKEEFTDLMEHFKYREINIMVFC